MSLVVVQVARDDARQRHEKKANRGTHAVASCTQRVEEERKSSLPASDCSSHRDSKLISPANEDRKKGGKRLMSTPRVMPFVFLLCFVLRVR